jgi:hypothetical protein
MKIIIDTKEESKENIKKVISFLNSVINSQNTTYTEDARDSVPTPSSSAFNMFGDAGSSQSSENTYDSDDDKKINQEEDSSDLQILPY